MCIRDRGHTYHKLISSEQLHILLFHRVLLGSLDFQTTKCLLVMGHRHNRSFKQHQVPDQDLRLYHTQPWFLRPAKYAVTIVAAKTIYQTIVRNQQSKKSLNKVSIFSLTVIVDRILSPLLCTLNKHMPLFMYSSFKFYKFHICAENI